MKKWEEYLLRITDAVVNGRREKTERTKKEEKKEESGLPKPPWWTHWVVGFGAVACLVLVGLLIWLPFKGMNWWQWVLWTCGIIFLLAIPRFPGEKERLVISVMGRFWRVYNPGPRAVLPLIMQVEGGRVSLRQKTSILFANPANPIKIDFIDGSATPKEVKVLYRVKEDNLSVYRSVYVAEDLDLRIEELMENALRSFLNGMKIKDALEGGRAGYDFIPNLPEERRNGILAAMDGWGLELLRATAEDFDLSDEIIGAREFVFRQERERDAAKAMAEKSAWQMGGFHGEMVRILEAEYRFSRQEANAVARDYVLYHQGTETGRIVDWRGGEFEGAVARIMAGIDIGKDLLKGGEKKNDDAE